MNKVVLIILSIVILKQSFAGPIMVGNGDDGADLLSYEPIRDGAIFESRKKAIEILSSYEVQKIKGLGNLLPEVENTKLYLAKKGLSAKKLAELGAFTNDSKGLVYARTMPEAYAATRFFPAALSLDESQLVALHIHEGLHRSLPKRIRENEEIVSDITKTIMDPSTSRDKISATVAKYIDDSRVSEKMGFEEKRVFVPEKSRLNRPSRFGFEIREYREDEDKSQSSKLGIQRMYVLSSHVYPFGENEKAQGLGFDASLVQTENDTLMGPLSISGRYQFYTKRDFDIEGFAELNLNTLSNEELVDSLLGRDTVRIGVTFATRREFFFVESDFNYTMESEVVEEIENVEYTYTFGAIYGLALRGGLHYKNFMFGGFTEILLADDLVIEGGDFQESTGRNRVVSWGPRVEYRHQNYSIVLKGRFLLDSSLDTNYDALSDLMGYGVGQGSANLQFNLFY